MGTNDLIGQVIHGHCLEITRQYIDDKSIDLVIIDPPYKIEAGGGPGGMREGIFHRNKGDRKLFDYMSAIEYMSELKRIVKESAHMYVFSNDKNLNDIITNGEAVGFKLMNVITLDKGNKVAYGWYMKQTEFVVLFRNKAGKAKQINNMSFPNLIKVNFPKGKKRMHPSEKSVELLEEFIMQSTNEGEIVFDCFAGSASVAAAAIKTNRQFICIEKDEGHFEVARNRIRGGA